MKQVLTVVAVMLLLAMPCRAAGEPEQVEGLDELWQAAESYGVEPDGDLSGGLSGLAEQALGQAGELLRRSAQTGLKLLAVAVFCGLAEGVYAGKREGGLQAVQMAGALAVTALSVSDMQTMIGLGRQTIEQMDGFAGLLLPVVAVLTAATGAATGAAVRQGATVLFSDLLIGAIDTLLVPIVYAYVAVCAAHAAVGNEGLKKLASVLKWVVTSQLTADLLAFVGYLTASIKNVRDTTVGDTVTLRDRPCDEPLPGYRKAVPMVFCGIYPADGARYPDLRDALEKLQLNDASLSFEPETSIALGFGFRCGFLGLLHMEIIQERLEREFNLDLVTTAPSVIYKIHLTDGSVVTIDNPTNYPDPSLIASAEEPHVKASIFTPAQYIGSIMELCQERRGVYKDTKYLDTDRVELHYDLPLNEIVYDFFDALKSRTKGYASYDYELDGYQPSKLVKLDILLNGEMVDALSFIVHADKAYTRARKMAENLKEHIPRQLFEVPIQAAVGGKVIARETVKAMRKDVLAKCYGGDITRKKKLLEKQKEGKKRMRQLGSVEVPQEAFMSVLKLD